MIHREAVLHIPLSQYAYAPGEAQLTIRLRAARGNLTSCTLCYGNRYYDSNPIKMTKAPMSVAAYDELFDYFEITLAPGFRRVCYCFALCSSDESLIYSADMFLPGLGSDRDRLYQYPFMRREEISDVPAWFKEAVVYNIFPDSFASGEGVLAGGRRSIPLDGGSLSKSKLGGTLRGITANLGYIKDLGFNCIYLNPIFTAGEYHKYDLIDYFHIDPCFGTDEDFAELVDTAHAMGMRVIIDGVFNHCGYRFFAFEDVIKNGKDSKYADWFYELEFPVSIPEKGERPSYTCFAYEPKMPKLNTSNPAAREYFMEVCRHWIRSYHIDGWRLDVANEVDREFWRFFRRAAKAENPECVLIAEIWESSESWLRGDMFDSTMNYSFRESCRDFIAQGLIDAAAFNTHVTNMLMRYPAGIVSGQLNLLDSHDVSRFLSLCGEDESRYKLAVLLLAVFPGVPSVFYGNELGVTGLKDQDYRKAMPWDSRNDNLTEFYANALKLRRNPAVIHGGFEVLRANPGDGVYAFKREYKAHSITVFLNAGKTPATLDGLECPPPPPVMEYGLGQDSIGSFGYAVWQKGENNV